MSLLQIRTSTFHLSTIIRRTVQPRSVFLLPTQIRRKSDSAPAPAPKVEESNLHPLLSSKNPLRIYRSTSKNPYFNLAFEEILLKTTPIDSTTLFTYTNSPCVVIGRNQNPWHEINFPLLATPQYSHVDFVRRRSGGGTVYHDEGNICWSIVMSRQSFTREKNAWMVVRTLKKLGLKNAGVNENHDVILRDEADGSSKKVSGSAYKIIRHTAYHHGTLLLNSDLQNLGKVLKSPLHPYISTLGVESKRSKVTNTGVEKDVFEKELQKEFFTTYNKSRPSKDRMTKNSAKVINVGEDAMNEIQAVKDIFEELQSQKFLYFQTPKFTVKINSETPALPGIPLPPSLPSNLDASIQSDTPSEATVLSPSAQQFFNFKIDVHNSVIVNCEVSNTSDPDLKFVQDDNAFKHLQGVRFEGSTIKKALLDMDFVNNWVRGEFAEWLSHAIGQWRGDAQWGVEPKDGSKTTTPSQKENSKGKKSKGGRKHISKTKPKSSQQNASVD